MINLYTWSTPNGRKVSIMLEELQVPYQVHPINLSKSEQFTPDFLHISPNNKIPAIVDENPIGKPITVFESGAILTYLAETYGKFLAPSGEERYKAIEWLHWQMGGLGPMMGQLGFFEKFSKEKSPLASARFLVEVDRLLKVMDKRLSDTTYLAGESFTITDIACYPWIYSATTFLGDLLAASLKDKESLRRWLKAVGNRSGVQRGMTVPS